MQYVCRLSFLLAFLLPACGNIDLGSAPASLTPPSSSGGNNSPPYIAAVPPGPITTALASANGTAYAVALQSDGKILSTGTSASGSESSFATVRYNTDGSLDSTFGSGGKTITSFGSGQANAASIAVLGNGEILVAGSYYDGVSAVTMKVVEYLADGNLDSTFGSGGIVAYSFGSSLWSQISSMVIQSDGKILVSGSVTSGCGTYGIRMDGYNCGTLQFGVVRLNANGSVDTTYGSGGQVLSTAFESGGNYNADSAASLLQTDGKLVQVGVSGNQTNFSGIGVVRYNTDGNLDTTFNTTGFYDSGGDSNYNTTNLHPWPNAAALQSDGKIVIAGNQHEGVAFGSSFVAARLNSNGTADTSFGTSSYIDSTEGFAAGVSINSVSIQSDGKILLVGNTLIGGSSDQIVVIRLLTDGSLDTSFNTTGILSQSIGSGSSYLNGSVSLNSSTLAVVGSSFNGALYDFLLSPIAE